MNKFLDTSNQPKSNHPNRFVASNEIEAVIVSQQRTAQDLMNSQLNSPRPLKKNWYHYSSNFPRK
jgi:hypothetical protein